MLVSRGEELDALPSGAHERPDVYERGPTASLAEDRDRLVTSQGYLTHVYAKRFVASAAASPISSSASPPRVASISP